MVKTESEVEIFSTAIYEILATDNKVEVRSSLINNSERILGFKDVVKKVHSSNEICWILLADGTAWSFDFLSGELSQLKMSETIADLACTHKSLYVVTTNNHVIEVSPQQQKKIHEFPKHQKIKKIVSGVEHCVILTSNGDVFSFGCGLRGALGHGDVNSHEVPLQVEALAGLKIIDIAAGSFHSVAVSSFGDVYSWGWNTNGQLGLPKVAQHTFEKASESHQQVYTVPQLIELEDDDEAIKNVFCGNNYTILRTERNRLFATGLNNYGQLGLSSHVDDIGKFTEMPVKDLNESTKIVCGHFSTFLIDKIK